MPAPLVSCTCPTLNRPHKHEGLYQTFCEQTYEPRELVVLDGSKEPSPFFSTLKDDPRVTYVHEPEPPREGGLTKIGAIRNRLTQIAKGEIVQMMDDDDEYATDFLAEMVRRLGDAAYAKLSVWRLRHGDDTYVWDTRVIGGPSYAIRGSTVEPTDANDMSPEEATAFRDAWLLGFAWSGVYRRAVALEIPFPEQGTEDVPWARALIEAGKKIVLVDDLPHIALHIVEPNPSHSEGGSPHFPQLRLRQASARRMMGAGVAAMTELPQGQKIQIEPGKVYRVLAAIKNSHSPASISARAAHWGVRLTESIDNADPTQYGVEPPPDGYRLVDFVGTGDRAVTLPWGAPKMLKAIGESSHLVKAWIGAGAPSDEDDAFILRAFVGAAAPMSAADAEVSEYDPERYKGKEPPHKCSAASALEIARQIDSRWTYASSPATLPTRATKTYVEVQTPTAKKRIPTWTLGDALYLQCPYTGQVFCFKKAPAQLGAGAPFSDPNAPPGFNALIASTPAAADAWNVVYQQLQLEGGDTGIIHDAETKFLNSYNGIVTSPGSFSLTADTVTSAAKAAGALVWNGTAQGAVTAVTGLVAAVESGSAPAIVQAFTGDAIAALTAAGALTGGVGAAVVVGIELVAGVLSNLLGSQGGPTTNVCGLNVTQSAVNYVVGCCFTNGTSTGQGPASRLWRKFPSRGNAADAWWFQSVSATGAGAVFGTTTWGPAGDTWGLSLHAAGGGRRPIDAAFYFFPQIDCDVQSATPIAALPDAGGNLFGAGHRTAEDVAWARFTRAFYSAWAANAEYALNGFQAPMTDAQVLSRTLATWNNAHSSSTTSTKTATVGMQPSWALYPNDPCSNRPYPDQSYIMLLANSVSSDGSITINTGPLKTQAQAKVLPPNLSIGRISAPSSGSGWKLAGIVAGVAAAAAGGVGIYAWRSGQSYGQAWKSVLGMAGEQTTASGKLLADAGPHKLLLKASESREKLSARERPQVIRFPLDKFSRQQATQWLRAEGFKSGGLHQEGEWWVAKQFSTARSSPPGHLRTVR